MTLRFDIKTVSEANTREHWRVRNERKRAQQLAFKVMWRSYRPTVTLPAEITFTRFSCKAVDSDNLTSCFKGLRDQLARELGIDDGGEAVRWRYEQVRLSKREHYFTVTIRQT